MGMTMSSGARSMEYAKVREAWEESACPLDCQSNGARRSQSLEMQSTAALME
jgi:hypothetical protein